MEEINKEDSGGGWVKKPTALRVPFQALPFRVILDQPLMSLSFRFLTHKMRIIATNSFGSCAEGDLR